MNTNVTFLQMPMVGQCVKFASNSGVATSSVVIAVNSDPSNAGWYQVTTASGSIYCGPVQADTSRTMYQQAPQWPQPQQAPNGYATRAGGLIPDVPVPPEIAQGLNWGAFFLAPFWSIAHEVWIGLLGFVPALGLIMSIALLIKGNEWGWRCRRFSSIEHFRSVQRAWRIWGIRIPAMLIGLTLIYIVIRFAVPAAVREKRFAAIETKRLAVKEAKRLAWIPASYPPISSEINPKDGAEMVWVPAGEFIMGSDDYFDNEKPQRKVYLDGYWMYKYEVTVAQYRKFCSETGRTMPTAPDWGRIDNHPIVNVTWNDAADYAKWAGASLPTEAQWEKAARGTDGREYPWGNTWDDSKCVVNSESPQPVGSKPTGASPYGCMDMAGNVNEWCADWHKAGYYKSAPSRNPMGPSSGTDRVLRGGGWGGSGDGNSRCATRYLSGPSSYYCSYGGGFRLVR